MTVREHRQFVAVVGSGMGLLVLAGLAAVAYFGHLSLGMGFLIALCVTQIVNCIWILKGSDQMIVTYGLDGVIPTNRKQKRLMAWLAAAIAVGSVVLAIILAQVLP
ncbi:MAG: hypothetical protein JSR45_06945 [Proteobacteria bacterium]|nr:hypothetical protein [Pseudomonadota bacterium]